MARLSTTAATQDNVLTNWAYLAFNSADPGTTGANEISGGSYARVPITWGAVALGVALNSAALNVNLPSATTVPYFSIWSAITAGTFMGGGVLTPTQGPNGTAGVVNIAIGGLSITVS